MLEDTIVSIAFSSLTRDIITEKPVYTWSEALGFIGGTLGLPCGVSILSFLEIVFVSVVFLLVKCEGVHNRVNGV